MSLVEIEYNGAYAILTLNRPEKRNAMSLAAQAALREGLEEIKAAGSKVVVLTGAGDISFCAGVDLNEPVDKTSRVYSQASHSWTVTQEKIAEHPAIFIAAVNGFALGGGLTLVHNCELAVASETASFGMPEITFGMYPALAGPATTHRILPKHAAWMTFMGQRIPAEIALEWGIVNEVVSPERLLPRAVEIAEHIAEFDAISLDFSKKAHRASLELGWDESFDYGLAMNAAMQLARPENR